MMHERQYIIDGLSRIQTKTPPKPAPPAQASNGAVSAEELTAGAAQLKAAGSMPPSFVAGPTGHDLRNASSKLKPAPAAVSAYPAGEVLKDIKSGGGVYLKKAQPTVPSYPAGAVLKELKSGSPKLKPAERVAPAFTPNPSQQELRAAADVLKPAPEAVPAYAAGAVMQDIKAGAVKLKPAPVVEQSFLGAPDLGDLRTGLSQLKPAAAKTQPEKSFAGLPGLSKEQSAAIDNLFWLLDQDYSGSIDVSELQNAYGPDSEELFSGMDADGDNYITRGELESFFVTLQYVKGGKTVELVVDYLRMNASAAANDQPITYLPVLKILTSSPGEKPVAVQSQDQTLSTTQIDRATALFHCIDVDHSYAVTSDEIGRVWGGYSTGMFDDLDIDSNRYVSLKEWLAYFERMLKQDGRRCVEFTMRLLENQLFGQNLLQTELQGLNQLHSMDSPEDPDSYADIMSEAMWDTCGQTSPRQCNPEPTAVQSLIDSMFQHKSESAELSAKLVGLVRELFEVLDLDEHGVVDFDDLAAVHAGQAARIFELMDSDMDGVVSLAEFEGFFGKLEHAKGSKMVELFLEYLRLNAQSIAQGKPITVLPMDELILSTVDDARPAVVYSPDAVLTEAQHSQAEQLFAAIDTDGTGYVSCHEIASVWGGDSGGLFNALDTDNSGSVSLGEWKSFFENVLQEQGERMVRFALGYFQRAVDIHEALELSLNEFVPAQEQNQSHAAALEDIFRDDTKHFMSRSDSMITYAEVQLIDQIFGLLDTDNSGYLDVQELVAVAGHDAEVLFNELDANSDDEVTREEFGEWLAKIQHTRGIRTVELLLQYLRVNAQAVAGNRGITLLPVCQLLLDNFETQKPVPSLNLGGKLSDSQKQRAVALFQAVDKDSSNSISKEEIAAVWGGESTGLFDALDTDGDGSVSLREWLRFFTKMLQQQGANVTEFAFRYFDRAVRMQEVMRDTLEELKGVEVYYPSSPVSRSLDLGSSSSVPKTKTKTKSEASSNPRGSRMIAATFEDAHAHPDQVLLKPGTLRLVEGLFELLDTNEDEVIDLSELEAVQAGDDHGLFSHMKTNDSDEITLFEFKMYFSKLEMTKGSRAVQMLIEYLRQSAVSYAQGKSFAVLGMYDVLLQSYQSGKPVAVVSPDERLKEGETARVADLFHVVDSKKTGFISKQDLSAIWGGDLLGLFEELDVNHDNKVSLVEWHQFFCDLLHSEGRQVMQWMLCYFERAIQVQDVLAAELEALSAMRQSEE